MKHTIRPIARFARNTSGTAAVEFAIVSVVFITMIFAIIYLGLMMHTYSTLQWAVENSVRKAVITENVTQTQMTTTVNGFLSQMHMPNANSVTYSVAGTTPPIATVTASLLQSYTIPFLGTYNINFSASAQMPQSGG